MPKYATTAVVALAASCLLTSQTVAAAEMRSTLTLEHALGPSGSFVPRGEVIVSANPESKKLSVKLSEPSYALSAAESDSFRSLLVDSDLYTVRVILPKPEGSDYTPELLASVPACALLNDKMSEMLHFHMDKQGGLSSISFSRFAGSSTSCPDTAASVSNDKLKFESVAIVSLPTEAMVVPKSISSEAKASLKKMPGMATAQMAIEEEDEEEDDEEGEVGPEGEKKKKKKKKKAEPEDMYSLMRKYWYVILPVAISLLMPAEQPPGEGEEGGSSATGKAAAIGSKAAAAAAAAGGVPVRRRGKKSRA